MLCCVVFVNAFACSRAIELLRRFYQGELHEGDTSDVEDEVDQDSGEDDMGDEQSGSGSGGGSGSDVIRPRKNLPPLLVPLSDKRPERLHWLGVSFGISTQLFNFWHSKAGFRPLYLRQVRVLF